mmetsp:Transcript_20803/g.45832  ORF Transcript_20803/g.45832 Transcript_20803/m.45832 type:complete len:84 (-) Transcript_20803:789-1040(-)
MLLLSAHSHHSACPCIVAVSCLLLQCPSPTTCGDLYRPAADCGCLLLQYPMTAARRGGLAVGYSCLVAHFSMTPASLCGLAVG